MKAQNIAAVLLAAVATTARAAEAPEEQKSTLSFTIENDSFFGTDRYYTHGFRLQYMHRPNDLPGWSETFLNNFPTLGMDVDKRRVGFALGQELYTPAHIGRRYLQENDRPYGGWLHASLIMRRAGMLAHSYRPKLIGLAARQHTGWLTVDGEGARYAPHTESGFRAPANKTALLLANGLLAKRGLRKARRAAAAST